MSEPDADSLEGVVRSMASEADIRAAVESAFDYRGDVTLTLKDGQTIEGYIFDRDAVAPDLAQCKLRILPTNGAERMTITYSDVAAIIFTGRDTAAGKSFEAWVKKYAEKKRAGEKNITLEPEELE